MNSLFKMLAVCGLVTVAFSASAAADTYRHVDQLALQIQRQAKQLIRESRHYRHHPEYSHLVADAREMSDLAEHIHELAHRHGSLAHLESDLVQLDAQFHHFESLINQIEWGSGHGHGNHGHVHGNTADMKGLLHAIEDNIHHLQSDLRSLQAPQHSLRTQRFPVRPYAAARPVQETAPQGRWDGRNSRAHRSGLGHERGHSEYPSGAHGGRVRGITIGGGSSRLMIRF